MPNICCEELKMTPLDLNRMLTDIESGLEPEDVMDREQCARLLRMLKQRTEALEEIRQRAENAKDNVGVLAEEERWAFLVAWGAAGDVAREALDYQGEPDA